MDQSERAEIEEHMRQCQDCLVRMEEYLHSIEEKEQAPEHHIPIHDLERYHLGDMDIVLVAKIEEHLSGCRECADRIMALKRFSQLVRTRAIKRVFE